MLKRHGLKHMTTTTKKNIRKSRGDSEDKRRLTFDLPVALHTKLKITAAKRNETMAEILIKLLEDNLK